MIKNKTIYFWATQGTKESATREPLQKGKTQYS
jgi:hypothetical protein